MKNTRLLIQQYRNAAAGMRNVADIMAEQYGDEDGRVSQSRMVAAMQENFANELEQALAADAEEY